MMAVGLFLLVYGYAIWFTRNETPSVRAVLSFVYLIPGWALAAAGYVSWTIQAREPSRQAGHDREKA